MSVKGSYHRRKSNNKNEVIYVPNVNGASHVRIEKQMLIDLIQVSYELGYKQNKNGMDLKYGEKMFEKITKDQP